MNTVDLLKKARAKIAQGFATEDYAQDANGDPVDPTDPRACCWCAAGALRCVLGWPAEDAFDRPGQWEAYNRAQEVLAKHMESLLTEAELDTFTDPPDVEVFIEKMNDLLSQDQALLAFDLAIDESNKEGEHP